MKLPLVSVIIPVYNAEDYVEQAIQSILSQTYQNLEILIADDGSSDTSKEILESIVDSRIKTFHNIENIGYLKTCNKLFKKASGDFIAFQDADDWSDSSRIETTMNFFLKNESISMCGCNFVRNTENGKVISLSNYPVDDIDIRKYIVTNKNLPFCGASVILKKCVLETIGGYKLFFDNIGYEHFDWFLRISEQFKIANISNKLYYYRYLENSFSRSNKLNDYKKYYARDIAFFLRDQRLIHGLDGLDDKALKIDFSNYLADLKNKFLTNRFEVYNTVVKNFLSNGSFIISIKLIYSGWVNKEINLINVLYFYYRVLRSGLKTLIRVK